MPGNGGPEFELVAQALNFPTSLAFDARGVLYVAESGLAFGDAVAGGRINRLRADGSWHCIADGLRSPVNGLTAFEGDFLVAEGGSPGRIGRLVPGGNETGRWDHRTIVDGLPGGGNYHTNMVAVGPDGWLYFSIGAMTNLGVVGPDGESLAWLRKVDHTWDVPGYDLVLTGENFRSRSTTGSSNKVTTGAFSPFGSPSVEGQRVPAGLPCTAAVHRCRPDGSRLEVFAWGLRNAYGLGFAPDGRLLATDQGSDDRGSRPVGNVPELLFEVRQGAWYGWPDYIGGVPVTDSRFRPSRGPELAFVLANHDSLPKPEQALAQLPVNSAATKFDFAPPGSRWPGQLFVALFGDEKPMTAPMGPPAGRCVARVNLEDGSYYILPGGVRLARPIDVRLDPSGEWLYVLDFGGFEMEPDGRVAAEPGSGKVWRVRLQDLD